MTPICFTRWLRVSFDRPLVNFWHVLARLADTDEPKGTRGRIQINRDLLSSLSLRRRQILSHGGEDFSVGDGYGLILVATKPLTVEGI